MNYRKTSQLGVTLLETLLVLAIAASIIVLGLRQYQLYRFDADIAVAKSNIDNVFFAAAQYYYANCYGQTKPNGEVIYGTLNPKANPVNPLPVTIATLRSESFLNRKMDIIPFFADTVDTDNSYHLQFNQVTAPRTVCQDTGCSIKKVIGTIVSWNIQVGVKIADIKQAELFKNLLSAQCVSKLTGDTIAPCPGNPDGSYVVFQRRPIDAAPGMMSTLNSSNPQLNQFQQEYITSGIEYLSGQGHAPEFQYFYCGG